MYFTGHYVFSQVKEKLDKASDQFRVLYDLAEKGALQIKCDVLSLEKQAQKDKDEFQVSDRILSLSCSLGTFAKYLQDVFVKVGN